MSIDPKISVIIPTYNRADLLAGTVNSVLAQSMADFELIVVDDGSTDNTRSIADAFNDKRLSYIYQENSGAPAARNHGWRRSSADYLLFLDSDDRLLPNGLQLLCEESRRFPHIGVIGGRYQYIDENMRVIGESNPPKEHVDINLKYLIFACPFIPSATIVSRAWFSQVAGFDEKQLAAQDWDLWLRLAAAGCPMRSSPHLICQYRLHEGNLSSDYEQHRIASSRALEKIFGSRDASAEILRLRADALTNVNIVSTARKYGAGDIVGAQQDLTRAGQLNSQWVRTGKLLERLVRAGDNIYYTRNYEVYITTVMENLPESLSDKQHIRRAKGRVAAANLFADYRNSEWSHLRRLWLETISNDPSWLGNVGVLSIGVEAFLGAKVARFMRKILLGQ